MKLAAQTAGDFWRGRRGRAEEGFGHELTCLTSICPVLPCSSFSLGVDLSVEATGDPWGRWYSWAPGKPSLGTSVGVKGTCGPGDLGLWPGQHPPTQGHTHTQTRTQGWFEPVWAVFAAAMGEVRPRAAFLGATARAPALMVRPGLGLCSGLGCIHVHQTLRGPGTVSLSFLSSNIRVMG